MVASMYKPLSVNTLVALRLLRDTFVDEIFDRKSANSLLVSSNIVTDDRNLILDFFYVF